MEGIEVSIFSLGMDNHHLKLFICAVLYYLAKNPNRVFTRDQLLDEVWGYEYIGDTRTIDVHIKRIREKVEAPERPWHITTVHCVGYKFETE